MIVKDVDNRHDDHVAMIIYIALMILYHTFTCNRLQCW